MKDRRTLLAVSAATLMALSMTTTVATAQQKEKCYGIAKAGQNDCANLSGTHSCAGQTKVDNSKEDWVYVAKGSCKDMKGMTADEAKMSMKK